MIPIVLWELYYLYLEDLDWIVGWKVATLRLVCDVLSYVILSIALIPLIQISFHKHCFVNDV